MRKLVRECVYKLIFAYLFTGCWDELLQTTLFQEAKLNKEGVAFAERFITSLKLHIEDVITDISSYSIGFEKERIFKADLSALILAVVEMRYIGGIDKAITIDQAVGLCRTFSAENSPSFVNGVLAAYVKKNQL